MTKSFSSGEQFLQDFHNRFPGITSRSFQSLPVRKAGQTYSSSYECLVSVVQPANNSSVILDIACGDGYLLGLLESNQSPAALASSSAALFGIDISQGELATAKQRLGDSATLVRGRAQSLPFPDHSMDYVLCHMALMLLDELDLVIGEIRRVLKTGGMFVFVNENQPSQSPAFDAYVSRLREIKRRHKATAINFGDARLATPEGIRHLLNPYFNNVQIEDISVTRRYTPQEMWDWIDGTYDLHLIPANERERLQIEYLVQLQSLCEEDGHVELIDNLQQVSAHSR